MFKKIFFISGLSPLKYRQISPQIGLGYLAETLKRNGFHYLAHDFSSQRSFKKLTEQIAEFEPDLLGIHMMSFGYLKQFELIAKLKCLFPAMRIIVGGPHASLFRERILEENSCIDYASILEGEETISELASGKPHSDIAGLIFREGDAIIKNREKEFAKDLDMVPFPTYENFNLADYPSRIIGIVTSRGCPYKCIYCPVRAAIGCQYRARSAENVFEEILYWHNRGYKEIWIQDDNFTLLKPRADKILDLILKAGLKGLRLALPNGIRSDRVDRELLVKMKRAGFFHIAFGVEAGNNRTLALLKKGETIEDMTRAIRTSLDVGIKVSLFFLVGSPGETAEDIEDSFELAKKYPVAGARFFNIIPFPHTELYDYLAGGDHLIYPPEYYLNNIDHSDKTPIFTTLELGIKERIRLLRKAQVVSDEIRGRYIRSLLPPFLRFMPAKFYTALNPICSLKKMVFDDPD